MHPYKRLLWKGRLDGLFDEPNANVVLDWLVASEGRLRVAVVGAGFTRNAQLRSGRPIKQAVPIWADVGNALADDLGIAHGLYDAPALADYYRAQLKATALHQRILGLLDDDDLMPGEAHKALLDSGLHAIITTNFMDTVLDKYNQSWVRVIEDVDLARINQNQPETIPSQLIYFHGHRSAFDSWVLSREQYVDIPLSRPLILARVRQLFAQFPLLVVGYSLNDPDFHALYRDTARSMRSRHPLGLALLTSPPERGVELYWSDYGLRIAHFRNADGLDGQFAEFLRITKMLADVESFLEQVRAQSR